MDLFFSSVNKWPDIIFLSFFFIFTVGTFCPKSYNAFDRIRVNGYTNFQAAMYLISGYALQLSADTNFTVKISRLTVVYFRLT